ncbi:oxidoreductase [Actinokineospora bangkokensis]|uniref:Carboxylic acid reductase n=1 Tax=Actinokineospora bangkokensis TaxID=1193682 RepID=A0A1Q9LN00_9PSEU|nr:oxidoreductase [Actinokineospora bangkokensis]
METARAAVERFADRTAIAEREREAVTDPATGETTERLLDTHRTRTYRELWADAEDIAAEWADHGALRAGGFLATVGFISGDYAALALAGARVGAVEVPLQASATAANLAPIVAEVEAVVLASSTERLPVAVEVVLATGCVRRVVVFDHNPAVDAQRAVVDDARARLAAAGVELTTLDEVRERGAGLPRAAEPDVAPDALAMLVYTSGSTGTPKGAIYTDSMVAGLWTWRWTQDEDDDLVSFNYMPMSHLAGRVTLLSTFARGGTAQFAARSDHSTLFEDMALAAPTELILVPRICDMLHQRFRSEVDRRGVDPAVVRRELREQWVGGRVRRVTVGTAPLSAEMAAFVENSLGVELHDGYGSTEAGALTIDHKVSRPPVIDYKLVDVPELGYFTTDSPHPRGELLVRTRTIIPGYYKRPELNAEFFDEDGFYRTGDIMAETAPDTLVYVDRRKNVLKLSQGEFVAVSRLEAVFASSPMVRQVYVHGSSERSYLLAVVVPTPEALASTPADQLRPRLLESLQRVAAEAELNPYEVPRDLIVETEPFSTENGLLSDVRKLLRPRLKEHYGARLEELYETLARNEVDDLRALREGAADAPVLETVGKAAQALLGRASTDISPDARFTDLGGDSLSALTFSNLLRELFGVEVPVGVVVSPANTLRKIAAHVEAERSHGGTRPTAATVHGAGAEQVRAADLTLEKFLDADTLAAAASLPRATATPRTVLLTGANGYLGRFLCLEWLRRLDASGGTLVCVVRGADDAAARARLDEAFDTGDPDLLATYHRLADEHLEVLAGDIGDADLGLSEQDWKRLAETVDLVVHPAALVNHVLPYDQLFGPNVVGTAELIRLALTHRVKPITYLSTVGVLDDPAITEVDDIRTTSPVRRVDGGYANGYSTSKWAGEVLLREAHEAFGLPVRTFRSDMILAHTRYTGQLNVPDMFTRLLFSVLVTGLAPASFYAGGGPAHYDGLPVDFTAEVITDLAWGAVAGHETYNVLNPHADGLSLDTFVDWLVEAGHTLHRVEDYQEWVSRLETALRALPEHRRQHSLLPLLHAFAAPSPAVDGSVVPAPHFHEAVRARGGEIPHLSAELITKYADDLKSLGLL